MNNRNRISVGEKLWNGAIVSTELAKAYNAMQDRIESFGDNPPEHLLNASHNLIAGAVKSK